MLEKPSGEAPNPSPEISTEALENVRRTVIKHVQDLLNSWEPVLGVEGRNLLSMGEESAFHFSIDRGEGQELGRFLVGKGGNKEQQQYIKKRVVSWAWDIANDVNAGREREVRSERGMSRDRLKNILDSTSIVLRFFDDKELPAEDKECIMVEVKKSLAKVAQLEAAESQERFDVILKEKFVEKK